MFKHFAVNFFGSRLGYHTQAVQDKVYIAIFSLHVRLAGVGFVGLVRVGLGGLGMGWIGLTGVGLGWVGLGWVGSG